MDDTSPEIREFLNKRYSQLSGFERMQMASEMFETAKKIVLSSLPPDLSEAEKRVQLFLRFYENDFSCKQRDEIIAVIRKRFGSY